MLYKRCNHKGCKKAGIYKLPKDNKLNSFWWFCKEHAEEYNKNWNFYEGMTPEEIEEDWEKDTFGTTLKDKKSNTDNSFEKFWKDFVSGKSTDSTQKQKLPANITSAFAVLDLPITATWKEVGAKYRTLAKKHHPDITKDKNSVIFKKITNAYEVLKKYFNK